MKRTKRKHSAELKARVALEAIRGDKTINEIAAQHDLNPQQITDWKAQMFQGAMVVFERPEAQKSREQQAQAREERLERKIGQLSMEVEFLSKKCKELGI